MAFNLPGNSAGMLGGAINDLTGSPSQSLNEGGKRDTMDVSSFQNWNGANLVAGSWTTLAEFICPPQNEYRIGYGSAPIEDTVGRWFFYFEDGAGAQTEGALRVRTMDSNDEDVDTVVSRVHTSDLAPEGSTLPDKRNRWAQPETVEERKVGEDSKIVLEFELSSGSTGTEIDETASTVLMQNTRYSGERSQ